MVVGSGVRTAMAGYVALAGGTVIGDDVTVGGIQPGFTGHLSVCDKVHETDALVTKSITVLGRT